MCETLWYKLGYVNKQWTFSLLLSFDLALIDLTMWFELFMQNERPCITTDNAYLL